MSAPGEYLADVAYENGISQGRCTCSWAGRKCEPGSERPYIDVDLHHCDTGHAAASRPARLPSSRAVGGEPQ